jgi:hypothetical protein
MKPFSGFIHRCAITLRSVLVTALFALPLAASAANQSAIFGGPGGAPFVDDPDPEARLVGVSIRFGDFIDAISAVYRQPGRDRLRAVVHGGNGGGPGVFELAEGEHIVAISGGVGKFVEWIQIHTNRRSSNPFGRPGDGRDFRIDVPEGHVMVGFVGRSGDYLDAIGLALRPVFQREFEPHRRPDHDGRRSFRIDGPVSVASTPHAVMLEFRLQSPGSALVYLGERRLSAEECFAPNEPGILQSAVLPPAIDQLPIFTGLRKNTAYHYSIVIEGGRCVSGRVVTAACFERGC